MSRSFISRVQQLGISPTAFGRYLCQHAQRAEHNHPFIAYVDPDEEIAAERAAEISWLWDVFIMGQAISQLKTVLRCPPIPEIILANHLVYDQIKSKVHDKRIDLIPVDIHYTRQTIQDLAGIRPNSSVLVILPPHAFHSARFIVERLREWIKSPTARISWISAHEVPSFEELLNESSYDFVIVIPGA